MVHRRLSRDRPTGFQHRLPARFLDRSARADHRERCSAATGWQAGGALSLRARSRRPSSSIRGTRAACAAPARTTSRSRMSSCQQSAASSRSARRSSIRARATRFRSAFRSRRAMRSLRSGWRAVALTHSAISPARRHRDTCTGLLREQAQTQFTVGQAEAAVRSGRAFLMEALGDLWHEVTSTVSASLDKRAVLRVAATHAIRLAAQVVDSLYNACRRDCDLRRQPDAAPLPGHPRDHPACAGPTDALRTVGQHLAGYADRRARGF